MSASPLGGGWDVDFVARNARDAPDAPACCEVGDDGAVGTRLSWRELDERVDAASRAIGACTPPGRRVICIARDGIAPLVALHACYRAGRSFVATDHASWPATRLAAIAADALCASAVCADDDESTRARGWFGDTIDAYVSLEFMDARDDTAVSAPSAPSALVGDPRWRELYVAYTSGSSGFGAKGTVATVDAVFRYCASKTRVEVIDSTARVCLASNTTFDIYPSDAYVAASARSCAVVSSRASMQADFASVLINGDVTHLCCTPTLFSLAHLPNGWDDVPSMRCVTLAGERMSTEMLERWGGMKESEETDKGRSTSTRGQLFNAYGATEATVLQTYAVMSRGDDPGRVGKAYGDWDFAAVHVVKRGVDGDLVFLEPGLQGEVAFSGRCVSGGYLNDPVRTTNAFVETGDDIGRVYTTGDVGWIDTHGHLRLVGRADRQVKIRGVRTELDEIEAHVASCVDLMEDAAVDHCADTHAVTAHVRIRGFDGYEARVHEWIYARALEQHVRRIAPVHAAPTRYAFYQRERWPLTSSGKTDRVELTRRLADGTHAVFRPRRVVPEVGLEATLAAAWAASLGLSGGDVGATDSFDALGGNSLNVLDVSRRLANDPRLSHIPGSTKASSGGLALASDAGIVDGEAAALLRRDEDEPAACAAGIVEGPFAPCEILARPALRDYAAYLIAQGVRFAGDDANDRGTDVCTDGSAEEEEGGDSLERCALAACGLGVVPAIRSLLKSGTTPRGSYLRAAAASVEPTRACDAVAALLNAGADPNDASEKGTRATHIAAARGNAAVLEALLDAGAFAGAKDFDKQTILHLAVRSGDVATTRVAAHACACLRTREGGLESWDRWKRTAGAWALRFGDAESLSILRDAGAKLTGLERDVSEYTHGGVTHHGELSERSEVQMRSRPARKRGASAEVIEALTRRLDERDEAAATEAAAALRELVCANAENRRASRDAGAVPKLLRRIRAFTCVESIGALRNIANDPVASNEAGELGAVDALVDVIRTNAVSVSLGGGGRVGGDARRAVFAAGSALRSLTLKDAANAERVSRLEGVFDLVEAAGGGDTTTWGDADPEDPD
jgi:acyl-coenzyme A synthetase/AMP-(fatty) acid ligase